MEIQMFFEEQQFPPDSLCFFIYKAHKKIHFKIIDMVLKKVIGLIQECRHIS